MKSKIEFNKEKDYETVLRSLQHFCAVYNFCSGNVQLNRLFSTIVCGNYSGITYSEKAQMLNYFLALEELLPALYELQEHLNQPEAKIGDESTYEDEVSAKDMFASFKRHPE